MPTARLKGKLMVRAGHIFELVQGKAKELVAEVSSLPEFSDLIWISPSPAEKRARITQNRATRGVLAGQIWISNLRIASPSMCVTS